MSRDDDFLSRWSRRKHAARRGEAPEPVPPPLPPSASSSTAALPADAAPGETKPVELPPVEALTHESDFTPFMREGVDPALRRQALRTLFRDPRFNVMDGLDVYIDDYSRPDPIPPEWLGKLNQMARLGDYRPPEDVPDTPCAPEELADRAPIQAPNQDLVSESLTGEGAPASPGSPEADSKDS